MTRAMSKPLSARTAVIFVNYNTSRQVIQCIRSLRNELISEIVVVDNASPNDNPDAIKAAFPNVVLISLTVNVGFGEGCNVGARWVIQYSDAQFLMFLNPDTVVERGLIGHLEATLHDRRIGIATPRITLMDDPKVLWYGGGDMSWLRGSASVPGCGGDSEAPLALTTRDVGFASGCALMIRTEVFDRCGTFDSRYFMYEEDVEFSLRIRAAGYRIRYIAEAVVRHVGQGSQGEEQRSLWMYDAQNPRLPFFVYFTTRNRLLTVYKHGNAFHRLLFTLGFPAWIVRRGLPWVRHGRFDAFKALFRGLVDAHTGARSF